MSTDKHDILKEIIGLVEGNMKCGPCGQGKFSEADFVIILRTELRNKVLASGLKYGFDLNQTLNRQMSLAGAYSHLMTRLIKLLNNEPSEVSFLETLKWSHVVGEHTHAASIDSHLSQSGLSERKATALRALLTADPSSTIDSLTNIL